nr:MAG TPA: hypothetical protein [Microviridae sp.]
MDILLQYLNIRSQKQDYVKITGVPCYSVFQYYIYGHSFTVFKHQKPEARLCENYRCTLLLCFSVNSSQF